jgi:uncharacterized protein YqgC (DUF456 family)
MSSSPPPSLTAVGLLAAGAIFVGSVVGGFVAGILVARQTGASWWPLVGVFVGLVAGVSGVVAQFRRAVR